MDPLLKHLQLQKTWSLDNTELMSYNSGYINYILNHIYETP